MDLAEAAKLIANVGFPIFVAAFLLIRLDPVLRELSAAVTKLALLLEEYLHQGRV